MPAANSRAARQFITMTQPEPDWSERFPSAFMNTTDWARAAGRKLEDDVQYTKVGMVFAARGCKMVAQIRKLRRSEVIELFGAQELNTDHLIDSVEMLLRASHSDDFVFGTIAATQAEEKQVAKARKPTVISFDDIKPVIGRF